MFATSADNALRTIEVCLAAFAESSSSPLNCGAVSRSMIRDKRLGRCGGRQTEPVLLDEEEDEEDKDEARVEVMETEDVEDDVRLRRGVRKGARSTCWCECEEDVGTREDDEE